MGVVVSVDKGSEWENEKVGVVMAVEKNVE